MARDFLHQIEHVTFPFEVRNPQDIRSVAVLRAAGMLEAIVPPEPINDNGTATILRITPLGRAELEHETDP